MSSRLNPYLSFSDNAREALEFYAKALGGAPVITTFGEQGGDASRADKVMHGMLETPAGYTLMAADTPPGVEHRAPNGSISLSLSGDDAQELRGYWAALSDGGTVTVPLDKQVWGDTFGMFTDRFGIAWMVNITE